MNYWLVKSEPETYSWDDLVRDQRTLWDGVRNYAARIHLKSMKLGDQVFYYHSVNDKCVVGIAEVVREFYPDPTADDDQWVVVDLAPVRKLKNPVTLAQLKKDGRVNDIPLIRIGRLSVMPISELERSVLLELAGE